MFDTCAEFILLPDAESDPGRAASGGVAPR
jgi:hypothetical protein